MNEISGPSLDYDVAVAAKGAEDKKAVQAAMVKLIETSGSTAKDRLPPDATFHTYA